MGGASEGAFVQPRAAWVPAATLLALAGAGAGWKRNSLPVSSVRSVTIDGQVLGPRGSPAPRFRSPSSHTQGVVPDNKRIERGKKMSRIRRDPSSPC